MALFALDRIDKLNIFIGKFASFLVAIIMSIVLLEVMLRYLFNMPTIWVNETAEYLFGAYFLLGASYTLYYKGHVSVDIFYDRFPLRIQAMFDIFTSVFFFLFIIPFLWHGGVVAWDSIVGLERTQSPWAPYTFPILAILPIAGILMLLQALAIFIRNVKKVIGGYDGR